MATTMQDFAALDAMFAATAGQSSSAATPADAPLQQGATAYGRDAPIKAGIVTASPAGIGPAKKAPPKKAPAPKKKAADPNEIWSETEVAEAGDVDDVDDGRKVPEYDIVFKQNVTPEDFFLGVDPVRHQGISCSDEVVLKVQLPGAKLAEIDLDVRPTFARISAPQWKLKAQFPDRVDETKGKAQWDADKEMLTVTLPIIHDLDTKLTTSAADEID